MIVPTSYHVGKLCYRLERRWPRVRLSLRESYAISEFSDGFTVRQQPTIGLLLITGCC